MNDLKDMHEKPGISGKPFFSILIPVYNAGSYIEDCLNDILRQDFQDWEIIIVDDVSSDDSVAKAEAFSKADPRIRIFRSDKNSGGPHTPRITASRHAKGEYVVPIDADDKVSDDLLKTLRKSIESHKADMVIPEMWRLKESSSYKILPLEYIDASGIWAGRDLVEHTLCRWAIPMAGFAVRRDIYIEADKMITEEDRKSSFVDELLSRWLLFMCRSVYMCDARYFYRENNGSVTNVNIPRIIDSKLRLCDSLISMTAASFGENSHTHLKALENKFNRAIDLLRLINGSDLKGQQKSSAVRKISSSMKYFDLSILKGKASPRYLALMSLPVPLARIALKILDPVINLKNGI